ncbi:hypothetical protein [Reinekea thalattae]|uniref:Uncharacterized protein n=1 Tax=Reinekea thalattae TaxID=2593301 RepID=A0A5C8ZC78_9GAMM|nr:hypothetical protein [Reinekea thalattae]TXR54773.1 hypothetical protein FME95_09630 [Reinekea thalattae]
MYKTSSIWLFLIGMTLALPSTAVAEQANRRLIADGLYHNAATSILLLLPKNTQWFELDVEPNDSDDALFQLQDADGQVSIVAFEYLNNSISNIAKNRHIRVLNSDNGVDFGCQEAITLIDAERYRVRSVQSCIRSARSNQTAYISTLLQTDDALYEVYFNVQKSPANLVKGLIQSAQGVDVDEL